MGAMIVEVTEIEAWKGEETVSMNNENGIIIREIWKMIEGGADLEVQEGLKATEVEAEDHRRQKASRWTICSKKRNLSRASTGCPAAKTTSKGEKRNARRGRKGEKRSGRRSRRKRKKRRRRET